jgi:hypothetical protein
MGVGTGRDRGLEGVVLVQDIALTLCTLYVSSQSFDFLLHLGMLGTLPNALEVGLDFAF